MNPALKNFLIFAAKNAVNAALTALTPVFATPQAYNLNTKTGLEHVGLLVLGAVVSRELTVWVPKLMSWSTTQAILFCLAVYPSFIFAMIYFTRSS